MIDMKVSSCWSSGWIIAGGRSFHINLCYWVLRMWVSLNIYLESPLTRGFSDGINMNQLRQVFRIGPAGPACLNSPLNLKVHRRAISVGPSDQCAADTWLSHCFLVGHGPTGRGPGVEGYGQPSDGSGTFSDRWGSVSRPGRSHDTWWCNESMMIMKTQVYVWHCMTMFCNFASRHARILCKIVQYLTVDSLLEADEMRRSLIDLSEADQALCVQTFLRARFMRSNW